MNTRNIAKKKKESIKKKIDKEVKCRMGQCEYIFRLYDRTI